MKIACDIDGVLADVREEFHYLPDWKEYFKHLEEHKPILPVIETIRSLLTTGHEVTLVTGRPESTRRKTKAWLRDYLLGDLKLIMRREGDMRHSEEIKLEVYNELKPDLILEDEKRTITKLVEENFIVLQVHGFRLSDEDQIPEGY